MFCRTTTATTQMDSMERCQQCQMGQRISSVRCECAHTQTNILQDHNNPRIKRQRHRRKLPLKVLQMGTKATTPADDCTSPTSHFDFVTPTYVPCFRFVSSFAIIKYE